MAGMDHAVPFADASPSRPLLLDGGLSTELERRGHDTSGPLWSARVLAEQPAAVLAVHRDFAAAGARVLLTGTYQATVDGLVRHGVRPSQAARVIAGAVALARGGAEQAGTDVAVAGSCGPMAAVHGGAAEYRGYGPSSTSPTAAELHRFHLERARILAGAGADLLAFETLPDQREVEVVCEVADELEVPAVVTVTTRDGAALPSGVSLAEVARTASVSRRIVAVGVNCLSPESVVPALEAMAAATDLPLVARPNAGARWDGTAWVDGDARAADSHLPRTWVAAGAAAVGGCCGTTPDDIRRMAIALADTGSG